MFGFVPWHDFKWKPSIILHNVLEDLDVLRSTEIKFKKKIKKTIET